MNKTNLFSLFVVVIVVIIAAEVLVNDYNDLPEDAEASVLAEESASSEKTHDWNIRSDEGKNEEAETTTEAIPEEGKVPPQAIDFGSGAFGEISSPGTDLKDVSQEQEIEAEVTFALIGLANFENVTLQRVPFNGILYERIDFRDFKSTPLVHQNLLKDNKDAIASFYEFHADSELLAGEIYLLIMEKSRSAIEASINETNQYGDKSFYINYSDRPHDAFLVVKMKESVYALTYRKELHSSIESLLTYLNT